MNSNMVIKSKSLNQQFDKKNEIRVHIKRLIRLDLLLIVRELVYISKLLMMYWKNKKDLLTPEYVSWVLIKTLL